MHLRLLILGCIELIQRSTHYILYRIDPWGKLESWYWVDMCWLLISENVLGCLWDSFSRRCPPNLVNISWKLSKRSNFSIFQWPNEQTDRHTDKKIKLHFCQYVREVSGKMFTNFGIYIIKTEQNIPLFHLLVNKRTNWRTHKQNLIFVLATMWYKSN